MSAASLYVHFPLCEAKCTYCDFYSLPGAGHDADAILERLLRDAERRAAPGPPTVFLGGGTPSFHSAESLERFLDRLDAITGFRASAHEVTAECNPESLDREKAEVLLASGVTRLSIGVQSLRPSILEAFGRTHTNDQAFAAVEAARAAGFAHLSTDLIYAVPGQELDEWLTDLERVLQLGLEHLSAYNLTFEPGTKIESLRRAGRLEPSDEETELAMFWRTRELTASHGLEAYEISNFARPGARCDHNLRYWSGAPYVGIGPSAVSRVEDRRWGNVRSLSAWTRAIDDGASPEDWSERISPGMRLAEAWWLGLRLNEGVAPQEARDRAAWIAADDPTAPVVERLVELGLVEWASSSGRASGSADRAVLTARGLPLADAVSREFIALADELDAGPPSPNTSGAADA